MVYLDDVSISAESAEDVAKAFALAGTFLWAWGVQLNPAKSSVACIGQTDRTPVSMLELQRVSSFKLLGINSGPRPSTDLLGKKRL
eukprot:5235609-Amphidinium_carterae.1